MIPILTLPDFRAAVAAGRTILITDSGTGDVVHQPPCPGLQDDSFVEKVLTNHSRNGGYFVLQGTTPLPAGSRRCGLNCPV